MKTELSDNDRQRIEQEAAKLFNRWDGGLLNVQTMLLSIAEYATLYERQQQFQKVMDGPYVDFDKPNIFMDGDNNSYSLMTSSDPEKREKGRQIRIHELVTRINQLEAERSELRNNIIDECIYALHRADITAARSILNSLKTK